MAGEAGRDPGRDGLDFAAAGAIYKWMEQLRLSEGRKRTGRRAAVNGASHAVKRDALTREDILNAAEVAELLQLRRSTVEDYARRGLLPSIKLGRFRRFVRADVEAELNRLRNGGAA